MKQVLVSRCDKISPKIMADLILLSTAEERAAGWNDESDLFNKIEIEMVKKMVGMDLEELINLFWSSLEMKQGS
jgi:hypothetical protein